jgi:hypothetical protein
MIVDRTTKAVKSEKPSKASSVYRNYSDKEREQFIDRMIECRQEKGMAQRLGVVWELMPVLLRDGEKIIEKMGLHPIKKRMTWKVARAPLLTSMTVSLLS